MTAISVGEAIPPFTATSTHGDISLDTLKGRKTVLYFYPKDNTPGCTTQAQGFRDLHSEFEAAGARIIGVSRDSLKSHQYYTDKPELPIARILFADDVH